MNIEEAIKSKLGSLVNFKCNYLKISMRRNVMTCIENSPLANRLSKTNFLGISFISITGYETSLIKGNPQTFIA